MNISQLAASPCSHPDMTLDEALAAYHALGFRKFEAFTSWAASAVDFRGAPEDCLRLARGRGMAYVSLHLPRIDDLEQGIEDAVVAARFARAIGARVVIYKAASRELYVRAARPFLDAINGLGVTPVLQNHVGSPIETLEHYRQVLDGIGDPRMHALLEVGMFHAIGVAWPEAYAALRGRIALVHVKDQIGAKRVPFGEGEVDFAGLFRQLDADRYAGDVVVEMEVDRENRERTLCLMAESRAFLGRFCTGEPV